MPPSPPVLRWCTCEECIQKHTNGTLMDARFLPAHQNCIQDEWRIGSAAPSPPAHSDDPTKCPVNLSLTDDRRDPSVSIRLDDLAGCLFALTLTDNGPNATDNANKLWNSHADFQERGPSSGVIAASPTPVSMDQVATSLGHLRISHLQPNPLTLIRPTMAVLHQRSHQAPIQHLLFPVVNSQRRTGIIIL
jgi:hypothetical protein